MPQKRDAIQPSENNVGIQAAGQAANRAAQERVFTDYISRKAPNTLRRQANGVRLFGDYLTEVARQAKDSQLQRDARQLRQFADSIESGDAPLADVWQGVTHGLVQGFVAWMLQGGYAITTINIHLSTLKTYTKLAFKAGIISAEEHAHLRALVGYSHQEAKRVDARRKEKALPTRVGNKKEEAVRIPVAVAKAMKQPLADSPQARRDALIMALLLDLGLRCGEAAILKVGDVDLHAGELRFYRPKVDKVQTHLLSTTLISRLREWLTKDIDAQDPNAALLRGTFKGGKLRRHAMSERAITQRVEHIGEQFGIEGLSAHDCRHFWATLAARSGTDPFSLQEAGGWNSLAMPRRYVEAGRVANVNVKLDE